MTALQQTEESVLAAMEETPMSEDPNMQQMSGEKCAQIVINPSRRYLATPCGRPASDEIHPAGWFNYTPYGQPESHIPHAFVAPSESSADPVERCRCCGAVAKHHLSSDLATCDFCTDRCRAPGPIDRNWYHGTIPPSVSGAADASAQPSEGAEIVDLWERIDSVVRCAVNREGRVELEPLLDRLRRAPSRPSDDAEIRQLANVLLDEFGGPTQSESACEMAVRMLREQRTRIADLESRLRDAREIYVESKLQASRPSAAEETREPVLIGQREAQKPTVAEEETETLKVRCYGGRREPLAPPQELGKSDEPGQEAETGRKGETPALPEARSREGRDSSEPLISRCHDCGRPYGDEHGFPDLIIPYWVWKQITPTRDDGGLLCPSCICKRLSERDIRCEGAFMSGPIISVTEPTMNALRRVENIELAIQGRDNSWSGVRDLVAAEKKEPTP